MKCQDFDTIITDLARDRIMEAAERETALAHTDSCPDCAGSLANQRTLTAGLRRFAEASETTGAPPRIANALQAAFREQLKNRAAAIGDDDSKSRHWRRRAWAAAAGIVILFAAAFIAWRIDRGTPGDVRTQAGAPQPEKQDDPSTSMHEKREIVADEKATPVFKPRRRAPAPRLRTYNALRERPENNSNRAARQVEIATDFISVSGAELMPFDEGLVVRVELPRSALVSFGLPMNMERADERIKADVVLGNDGLARAIRFVH
jgi:hypothetical protein